MAASPRKHVVLVANVDTTIQVTGRGLFMVQNHSTAVADLLYVNTISGAAAVSGADDTICIDPGGFRIFEMGDHDGQVDIHVISASAVTVSAEHYVPFETD